MNPEGPLLSPQHTQEGADFVGCILLALNLQEQSPWSVHFAPQIVKPSQCGRQASCATHGLPSVAREAHLQGHCAVLVELGHVEHQAPQELLQHGWPQVTAACGEKNRRAG